MFVLRQEDCQVECYIDLGKDSEGANLAAFRQLEARRLEIDAAFGEPLEWQELNDRRGCRICKTMGGGWRTAEVEWPALQDRLIGAMARLDQAFRAPIQDIKFAT
jgi:hypothetical protein